MTTEKKQDELLDHNYDGIQEYDNDLPRWWVWLFVITVVWGFAYAIWFHGTGRPTPVEQLALDMQEISALQAAHQKATAGSEVISDEKFFQLAKSTESLSSGKAVYVAKCLPCHGELGQGVIGPNLTDTHWIHGGTPAKIRYVIEEGVLAKGMLAWKTLISHDEIVAVTAYVLSLKGTNPPNPKPAEGEFIVE